MSSSADSDMAVLARSADRAGDELRPNVRKCTGDLNRVLVVHETGISKEIAPSRRVAGGYCDSMAAFPRGPY
jgi:hypothetical protein